MNAKNVSRIGIGLSLTLMALLLCGAPVLTTSCAGDGDSGGSGGGQGGGSGGQGGGSGGGGGTGTCSDPAADAVNFCSGKAQGKMSGYAYIALGAQDTATDPKCAENPDDLTTTRAITASGTSPGPCPTTGTTVWKNTDNLCISGTIPKVVNSDYKNNWGLQIGVNTVDPPATAAGSGTLGETYSTIALSYTGTISPENKAIRAVIHLVSMAAEADPYCATIEKSGTVKDLTSFNTKCWGEAGGLTLTAADIPNIDKIGIQISSDINNEYAVTDFCLTGIQFGK